MSLLLRREGRISFSIPPTVILRPTKIFQLARLRGNDVSLTTE